MRVVYDTNILISALLTERGTPGTLYQAWLEGAVTLLTCQTQMDELRQTLLKPKVAKLIRPASAGFLVNQLKSRAVMISNLPYVRRSPDPQDDYLLALSQAGRADYLVTGDKRGLLDLASHKGTRIISAADFVTTIS